MVIFRAWAPCDVCGALTHVGFAWEPRLQWPTVIELEGQVFKLEGVIYYVDSKSVGSMGFH